MTSHAPSTGELSALLPAMCDWLPTTCSVAGCRQKSTRAGRLPHVVVEAEVHPSREEPADIALMVVPGNGSKTSASREVGIKLVQRATDPPPLDKDLHDVLGDFKFQCSKQVLC